MEKGSVSTNKKMWLPVVRFSSCILVVVGVADGASVSKNVDAIHSFYLRILVDCFYMLRSSL